MTAPAVLATARALVAPRGCWRWMSNPTCDKRFAAAGIAQTQETRRAYRELMLGGSPPGHLSRQISQPGVSAEIWSGVSPS